VLADGTELENGGTTNTTISFLWYSPFGYSKKHPHPPNRFQFRPDALFPGIALNGLFSLYGKTVLLCGVREVQ